MGKRKGKKRIYVSSPIYTITIDLEGESMHIKTNSTLRAAEFFQNGHVVKMDATRIFSSKEGERISSDKLVKFSINFKSGKWRAYDASCVYVISE